MTLRSKLAALLTLACLLALSGCVRAPSALPPAGQATFADYQRDTTAWVQQHRHFQSNHRQQELIWNTPQEWRPAGGKPEKGVLLIHGLGDAPGSFSDIGPQLARQGFLVRTLLLPGHGTRPQDLIGVSINDWRQVVNEQAAIMQQDVAQVWLGGFSTGGNLALEYAIKHPQVAGLLLFSPAIKSNVTFDFVTPLLAVFTDWLREPRPGYPEQRPTRYMMVPTNGFAQFYRTSAAAQQLLSRNGYSKPTLMVLTEHDSVLATMRFLSQFDSTFTHPASRLIWYGNKPASPVLSARVLIRPDRLPQRHISQFSHMSVLFAPDNPLYGEHGSDRMCENGQTESDYRACRAGAEVWFSDWGYRETGKIHARLTWNPYFAWQNQIMTQVMTQK
ncbi:lysophospholipase [Erwiniaceae bacterium BAC15a-03b]|uniref:Lysophospholipase n=1 Tax=Winslowiella arboricola TaxID=2978220 RepID=A0A9J6PSY6_9GAMM|nr:alpha/beta fold hydrolase [Winslowiella arboricola]MCU5773037.1 lysophospholipase [Winslowiella arboricola]MCU5777868.1 lysophospholipase [Winslowiella arboricola]